MEQRSQSSSLNLPEQFDVELKPKGEEMSASRSNASQLGHNDDIVDFNDVNADQIGSSLDTVNKGVADQLIRGGIIRQPFSVASALLDEMTKISRARHTREDQMFPLNLGLAKEHLEKNQELHEKMAKIMTHMDLLTKHVMGGGYKVLNAVGSSSGVALDDAQF
ncbi:hypothetical protein MTR67_039655 [Solanum verrucosum]|uniref:Uncharacterized protein n=1 Tax=Solanum verrucosum TaxID=315347 RepID=A0AAF0UH93_SOLVR|nr:hypothetical protein MTR67_039655 [Solanum verrucosum]